jgi:hypothetical protein
VSRARLRRIDAPGPELLGDAPTALLARLGGPALLRLPGRDRGRTRALATLLHGNEPSGLRALHAWLRGGGTPAVDVLVFVGAVEAALAPPGFAHRMLPGRHDLNRCFRPPFEGAEGALADEALRALRAARPECLVDLHNNTGHNPAYGVTGPLDEACLALVGLFADRVVTSDLRLGTLTEAMATDAPSVTIECGRAGDPAADAVALSGLRRYLERERVTDPSPGAPALRVLEQPIRVTLRPGVSLAFSDTPHPGVDLTVRGDIDRHNFELLLPGVPVGWLGRPGLWPIEALDARGEDVSRAWFTERDGLLETRRAVVPIMMTTDARVAASDCLFYVVREREGSGSAPEPPGTRA